MIPALPPHRRLRSLALPLVAAGALAGGLGYVASIWPAPAPFVVPRDRPDVTLAPLSSMYTSVHEGPHCLAALDDFVRRPNWQLTLTVGQNGCVHDVEGWLVVDADGDAVWTTYDLPARPLHLTPLQLSQLHAAASLSCEPPSPTSDARYVTVQWGGPGTPGMVVNESPARAQLDAFVEDALDQYRYRRLGERAGFSTTVALPPFSVARMSRPMKITFDAQGRFLITVDRRTIVAENLPLDVRVDAIDWVELGGIAQHRVPSELSIAIDRALLDAEILVD